MSRKAAKTNTDGEDGQTDGERKIFFAIIRFHHRPQFLVGKRMGKG